MADCRITTRYNWQRRESSWCARDITALLSLWVSGREELGNQALRTFFEHMMFHGPENVADEHI